MKEPIAGAAGFVRSDGQGDPRGGAGNPIELTLPPDAAWVALLR
jgi:hypothetical protein